MDIDGRHRFVKFQRMHHRSGIRRQLEMCFGIGDGGGQTSAGCNVSNFTTLPNTLPGLPVASGNEGNASMPQFHRRAELPVNRLMEVHSKHMSTKCFIHRNCAVIILSTLLGVGVTLPVQAQMGLGLVPMRNELNIAPGQQVSGALKLSSESGAKVRIRAEVDDFFIDDTDTPQFERDIPHEAAYSCKTWLSLNPMEIELEKGGSLLVRYTIRVPADAAEGSYNCAAGFTTLRPASETAAEGMGMHMAVRIVSAFYVQVGKPAVVGSLKEIKLEAIPPPAAPAEGTAATDVKDPKDAKGNWQAVVVLENSGQMYFRPAGKLEVLSADGKTVETDDFPIDGRLAQSQPARHFSAQDLSRTRALHVEGECRRGHRAKSSKVRRM